MKKFVVICNPDSGTAIKPKELAHLFAVHGVQPEFLDVKKGISELVDRVIATKPDVVVASGGDGTVNAVANVVVQTGTILAALPTGTFNHFTKDIKIPHILTDAIDIAINGDVQALDYGTVNGYVFMNSSSIGAYPKAVLTREDLRPNLSKMVAMAVAIAKVAKQNRTLTLKIEIDGKSISVKTPSVFVGNNPFIVEGLGVPVRNRLQTGELGIYILKSTNLRDAAAAGAQILFGKVHQKLKIYTTRTGLRINSEQKKAVVSLDGEVADMEFPLDYHIYPGGIKVMVPRGRKDGFDVS